MKVNINSHFNLRALFCCWRAPVCVQLRSAVVGCEVGSAETICSPLSVCLLFEMSYVACVFLILVSAVKVHSKAVCKGDDVSISDLKADSNEKSHISRELSEEDPSSGSVEEASPENVSSSSPLSVTTSKREMPNGSAELEEAMEKEGGPGTAGKSKRQVCDEILEQLKNLPCDNPVVITCGGEERSLYPCGPTKVSPLRAALSDVDNILGAAQAVQPPSLPVLPPVSPIQTIPVNTNAPTNNLVPGIPSIGAPTRFLQPTRILTEAERRERQKGIFEGLLRFGTVVNHIDSFLTEKGKMIVRGLHRMVQSEEENESRF